MSRNIFLTKKQEFPYLFRLWVGGETVSPTDGKLSPAGRKSSAFSLCIRNTGCGLKQ